MYRFYNNCVNWNRNDVPALSEMINNSIQIERKTFRKHVDAAELLDIELLLSYDRHPSQGLTMAGDYHVSYHRSKLHEKRVYYFRHSAIEYVFTEV